MPPTYYHATSSEASGTAILADGVLRAIPPRAKYKSTRGRMVPLPERVYLTPSRRYAAIYALGGVMMGYSIADIPGWSRVLAANPYGYVFEVPEDSLRGRDVVPDEDAAGHLAGLALSGTTSESLRADLEDDEVWLRCAVAHPLFAHFADFARRHTTPIQARQVQHGIYSQWAALGKKLVKAMTPAMRAWLIDCGTNIAVVGPVPFTAAWRLDKQDAVRLRDDGANLFDLATPLVRPSSAYRSKTFDLVALTRAVQRSRTEGLAYAREHLALLGEGSDRAVFLLSSRKALKVATTDRGESQNMIERAISEDPAHHAVIARVLDHEPRRFRWLIAELVRPVTHGEWVRRTGVADEDHLAALLGWAERSTPDDPISFEDALEQLVLYAGSRSAPSSLVTRYHANRWLRALYDLVAAEGLLSGDLDRPNQYGLTPDRRLVLLDYGYSANSASMA